jgi:hypothetical protein
MGLPKALMEAKIINDETVFCQKKDILALQWKNEGYVGAEQQMHCLGGKTSNKDGNHKMKQHAL